MPEVDERKLLSLVIPVYNEERTVAALFESLDRSLAGLELRHEIVLVDDGSLDATWHLLKEIAADRESVTLLRFTRNFGKEAAIMAGLEACTGDAAIVLDADLQHPPDLLSRMTEHWLAGEADVIDAVKTDDQNAPVIDRFTSFWFNRLFHRFTGHDVRGASDYKLLDRRVIDVLAGIRDYNLFFRGTTLWLGFRHKELGFPLGPRSGGRGKWNTLRRLELAITAITSFTALPLHLMSVVGVIFALWAVFHGAHTLYNKFSGQAVEGFTTVILLLLIIGSIITIGLGIIGAYLSKIHDEVRDRPRYLVGEVVRPGESSAD